MKVKKDDSSSRREFLAKIGIGATICLGGLGVPRSSAKAASMTENGPKPLSHPEAFAQGNHLERMRLDLIRAQRKPESQRKWVMVIDQQLCIRCRACNLSCCSENNLPPGMAYRDPSSEVELGRYPDAGLLFTPRPSNWGAMGETRLSRENYRGVRRVRPR